MFEWDTLYANKNCREGDTEALCFSPLKSISLTHLKLSHLCQHSPCYDFCFSLHPTVSLDETLQIWEEVKSTLRTAHNLHWHMNKCNPDIRQGGGLKVKAETNAIETAFVAYDKEGKATRLTNAEWSCFKQWERMTFKLKREILSKVK